MSGSWPDIGPRQIHAEDDRTPVQKCFVLKQATRAGALRTSPCSPAVSLYLMWSPEIAREITSCWISEVPSKIV
jgi:hypothetical protein